MMSGKDSKKIKNEVVVGQLRRWAVVSSLRPDFFLITSIDVKFKKVSILDDGEIYTMCLNSVELLSEEINDNSIGLI